jgi:hypothetical protein
LNRLHVLSVFVCLACACGQGQPAPADSGSAPDSGPAPDSGTGPDSGSGNDAGGGDSGTDAGTDAGGPYSVTFSYTPGWTGVKSVVVIGGFDAGVDWKAATPFVTLNADDAGYWSGTAMLPGGQYLYLLVARGDDAGTAGTAFNVLDPANSAYLPCPPGAPTYSTAVANPCSLLTVPQPAAPTLYNVSGIATYDGGAAAGYLAILERDETGSHHQMVNRADVQADGTFSLPVAPGAYRWQIWYPTWFVETDSQRDGLVLNAYRRTISSAFTVSAADVQTDPTELSFYRYAAYAPLDGGAPLPATFDFPVAMGATSAHAALYGGNDGGLKNIGDPWWTGAPQKKDPGMEVFDGGFNTAQAQEPAARPGERYLWGAWQVFPKGDAGTQWTGESMVFPVVFQ